MRYLSVCSGIEAATVAWHPLGWTPVAFSEIDRFASAVLAHHYPGVPNLGDFTKIEAEGVGAVDLLVGGTPCQDFSVAGFRSGMAGDRGQLTIAFLRLLERLRPRWVVWENVPGVLSSRRGRDFGAVLGLLEKFGYGWAYRILDAQFFGVPQRRRRVFVVGYLGDERRAPAVLFDRESVCGNPPPRREAGQVAPTIPARSSQSGQLGSDFESDGGLIVAHSLRAAGHDASEDGAGRGTPLVVTGTLGASHGRNRGLGNANEVDMVVAFSCKDDGASSVDVAPTLRSMNEVDGLQNGGGQIAVAIGFSTEQTPKFAVDGTPTLKTTSPSGGGQPMAVALTQNSRSEVRLIGGDGQVAGAVTADPGAQCQNYVSHAMVRRLTPRECERLQGFPDDYTLIADPRRQGKPAANQPRYHVLGNSMAVPCMRWIGERIQAVENLAEGPP